MVVGRGRVFGGGCWGEWLVGSGWVQRREGSKQSSQLLVRKYWGHRSMEWLTGGGSVVGDRVGYGAPYPLFLFFIEVHMFLKSRVDGPDEERAYRDLCDGVVV